MKFLKSSLSFLLVCLFYSTISIPIITSPPLFAETKNEKTLLKWVNKGGMNFFLIKLDEFRNLCQINCYIVDEMILNAKAAQEDRNDPNSEFTAVNRVYMVGQRHGSKGKVVLAEFYSYIGLTFAAPFAPV
tara:strand:+ start:106 stop:498 length:393 start_codon:yes stop_codon:yes gene_type:complete